MPTFILPNAIDANGDPVNGALAKVYLADGTTPATTYSDEAMSAANAWPIVYSAAGTPGACYVAEGEYKLDLQTSAGVSLDGYPKDDIAVFAFPIGLATGGTGTTTGPTLPTQTFLSSGSSGTYTVPANVRMLEVQCWGAGGGGGGVDGQGSGYAGIASSGGSGAYVYKLITSPAASYSYAVGSGGAGGAAGANNGSSGGATTFSDGGSLSLSAGGGGGGVGHTATNASTAITPGTAGSASGGDTNIAGYRPGTPRIITGVPAVAFNGASAPIFGVGGGVSSTGAGGNATVAGAGGGGALVWGLATDYSGGDGAGGLIRIREYY